MSVIFESSTVRSTVAARCDSNRWAEELIILELCACYVKLMSTRDGLSLPPVQHAGSVQTGRVHRMH